ncbi:TPA: recombinase family protein [Raoultella ornithinolytica]
MNICIFYQYQSESFHAISIKHHLSTQDLISTNPSGCRYRRTLTSWLNCKSSRTHFRSLTDSIDTSTQAGRFFFHVMSALAEMERELIVERTRAGLAAAREQGRIGGRRRVMTTDVVERARRMLENGATRKQVADVTGVDVKTIYKYLPAT